MDDFLTIYRQNYCWPAGGRRLVRGPRPPPDTELIRKAIESWEKTEGLCSMAWTGSDESEVGATWLSPGPDTRLRAEDRECSTNQRDRLALASLREMMFQRSNLEYEILDRDKKRENLSNYTSTYQRDYTKPGNPPADETWSISELVQVSRGKCSTDETYSYSPPKERSGDRCNFGERAKEMPTWKKCQCHKSARKVR